MSIENDPRIHALRHALLGPAKPLTGSTLKFANAEGIRQPDPPVLVGFSTGRSFWTRVGAWAITKFTGGSVDHAFLMVWSDEWRQWLSLGAERRGLAPMSLSVFEDTHKITACFAANGFSLWDGMRAHVDDLAAGYDFTGMAYMSVVTIARRMGIMLVDNPLSIKGRTFCSAWVAAVVNAALTARDTPTQLPAEKFPDVKLIDYRTWPFLTTLPSLIEPSELCAAMAERPALWTPFEPDLLHSSVMPMEMQKR